MSGSRGLTSALTLLAVSVIFSADFRSAHAQSIGLPSKLRSRLHTVQTPRQTAQANILRFCLSAECRKSIPGYRALKSSRFRVIYAGSVSLCSRINASLNSGLSAIGKSGSPVGVFPRRLYNDIDFEHLFGSSIFTRWTPVPAYYNDRDLYFGVHSWMSSPGAPDAWVVVPYSNDGISRLVVAWPHGQEYSTFTVDAGKLLSGSPSSGPLESKLSNGTTITSTLQSMPIESYDRGVPVYRSAPMSVCQNAGDPLQAPTGVSSQNRKPTGEHCSTTALDHIHIPYSRKNHYPSSVQLGPYGGILGESATEFALVDGKVEVLYVNTDADFLYSNKGGQIGHLPSKIFVRVIQFSRDTYREDCLLVAEPSAHGFHRNDEGRQK